MVSFRYFPLLLEIELADNEDDQQKQTRNGDGISHPHPPFPVASGGCAIRVCTGILNCLDAGLLVSLFIIENDIEIEFGVATVCFVLLLLPYYKTNVTIQFSPRGRKPPPDTSRISL
jgi:hypothetical protein